MKDCMTGFPPPEGEPDLYAHAWCGSAGGTIGATSGINTSIRDRSETPQNDLQPSHGHRAILGEAATAVHVAQSVFHQDEAPLHIDMPLSPRMECTDLSSPRQF